MEQRQRRLKTYSDGRGGLYTLPVDDVLTPPTSKETLTSMKKEILLEHCDTEEVTLDLDDHLFVNLALRAHEHGVTLNEYINTLILDALKDEIELSEKETMLFNMDK